jgi:hypothetical protein
VRRNEGMMPAFAAGALFGVSDNAVKYLTHTSDAGVLSADATVVAAALPSSAGASQDRA